MSKKTARPATPDCPTVMSCVAPLTLRVLAEGTPRLGLVALDWPGLAPAHRLHLLRQLLRAAGRDQRPSAADRDPHAFHGIEQDAPPGEPGPEPARRVVSRPRVVVWHGFPLIAESLPVSSA